MRTWQIGDDPIFVHTQNWGPVGGVYIVESTGRIIQAGCTRRDHPIGQITGSTHQHHGPVKEGLIEVGLFVEYVAEDDQVCYTAPVTGFSKP